MGHGHVSSRLRAWVLELYQPELGKWVGEWRSIYTTCRPEVQGEGGNFWDAPVT